MANCGTWPVGVCSWSLQRDIDGLAKLSKTGRKLSQLCGAHILDCRHLIEPSNNRQD